MKKQPNFFIIGAPRSGTTSLYSYLREVPEVFMSSTKELNFFSPIVSKRNNLRRVKDEKKYFKMFKNVKDEIAVGEASPSYLRDPHAPILIHKTIPNAKIIILLRDPVERSYSHHLLKLKNVYNSSFKNDLANYIKSKDKDSDFFAFIINPSLYYHQVEKYLEIFGSDNVKIIIFEEFVKDVHKCVKDVLKFLNIKSEPPKNIENKYNAYNVPKNKLAAKINYSKFMKGFVVHFIPRKIRIPMREKILRKKGEKPKLDHKDREILIKLYYDDVQKLENLIGRNLPWVNFKGSKI